MDQRGNESPKKEDDTDKRLEQLREAVNAQIARAQNSAAVVRKQSMLKDSFSFTGEAFKEQSPSLSPRSSSPRSSTSTRLGASVTSTINPSDYPFPSMESVSGSGSGDMNMPPFPRAGSAFSDATVRFRPSVSETTPIASRRSTYNDWAGPRDFPSPNIYDLTLKMNADIGMESFWQNIIEIFVTNFYASRVSLSIPYDLTDINNTPWGLKATYKGSIDRQQTRIKLERRQSEEMNAPYPGNDTDTETSSHSEDVTPKYEVPKPSSKFRQPEKKGKESVGASIEEQLDQMLSKKHVGKVYPKLKPLEHEDEPLIDNIGVQRVLNRGAIVVLSREYHDLEEVKRREEERLKAHQDELKEESSSRQNTKKPSSIRSEVLAAWEKTYFKPPERGQLKAYEEYEQPLASPWSQSPAPSPAILRESSDNPFFDPMESVEAAFSPNDEPEYAYTDAVYAIGMENAQSVIHIPLVHPQTSKSISSEGESSGSSGHPRIVPIAIISFCSAVAPYPVHLMTSLSTFAPLIATSLSQAIRHSNVLHQLTFSPMQTPRYFRPRHEENIPEHRRTKQGQDPSRSPVSHSSATNSDTSTPSWELQDHLFSPAVAQAEVPSPFRSTLSTDTDYFSVRTHGTLRATDLTRSSSSQHRAGARDQIGVDSSTDDFRPESSSKSSSTAPTEQSNSPLDKMTSPIRVRKRSGRRATRMVHSHGATTQFPGNRPMPRKGKIIRSSGSFSDASDPYQMPTPSSRLLKVVVDSIPVHVFTASPGTGTITWANGRTLAYRGVTAEEYIENPHASLHPEDSKEFLKRWNRMLQLETEGISLSVRIKRFDGQYRWFAARVVPLRDSRGGVVHWFGTSMDIHDAREAEIDTARQEEVKASEMKYRLFAEASPQIVFAASPAFGISYANSQWMNYSGVTYEETVKLGFLSFVHSDDRARCSLPAASGDSHPQLTVEIRLQGADKSYRWFLVKCIRIEEHGDGKDDVWLGTCTDIHDHKMLEQRLKQASEAARAAEAEHKKRAEDALETRRQQEFFIDMVSHELRNPLSAIVQSSDVVLNSLKGMQLESISPSTSHQLADDIETMKSIGLCTMHMRRLIDDTINISKLESGMLQVTPVDCQPVAIVKQIQQIFDAELQSKKIEMEIRETPSYRELEVDWVRADPSRISQILINLLSNAIKFLDNRPERKITLTLSASTTPPKHDAVPLYSPELDSEPDSRDRYLSFSINDTGPGLKPAEMAALFQRFSQATPRTHVTYGGSGLGLFISKRLVELQGGRIYVDSTEGKGSTFSFFIKVERSTVIGSQKKSPTFVIKGKEKSVSDKDGNQVHVLVVEDNLINQKLLKRQLVTSGYRVSVANQGQEAVDKVLSSQNSSNDKIHVVLMDVEMPVLNGLQATKLLREAEANGELRSHIPVIAVSANARDEQKKRMFDAGADSYLTKPFQLPELVAKLKEQTQSVP